MNDDRSSAGLARVLIPNATVFLASACIMIVEIVAGRIISRYLGQSLYTWTSVIGIVLAGISIGNYLGGRLADRFDARRALAALFLLSSLACLVVPPVNIVAGRWLFLLNRDWPVRIFLHVFMTFILPSCALGTISPVVARMALQDSRATGRTIGSIYAWGAAGSILGTFLAGFYLIAVMGTFAVVALVAAVLAVMGLLYAGSAWWSRLVAAAALLALFAAAAPGRVPARLGEAIGFRTRDTDSDPLVFEKESPYACVRVRANREDSRYRKMYIDKLMHSGVNIEKPLELVAQYAWVYEAAIEKYSGKTQAVDVLVIGGGGYVTPRFLAESRPDSTVYVAEIDPVVTDAARQAMGLASNEAIRIFDMDAANLVDDLVRKKGQGGEVPAFDYICGDSINDFSVPYHLTTLEFTEKIRSLMKPDGIYFLHFLDMYDSARLLGAVVSTLDRVFPHVYVFAQNGRLEKRGTFMAVCSLIERDLSDLPALMKARHPDYAGLMLSEDQLADVRKRSGGIVLTDDYAPVENLVAPVVRRNRDDLLERHLHLASLAFTGKRYDEAAAHLTAMTAEDPTHAEALYGLARVALAEGRLEEAAGFCDRALGANAWHWNAKVLKGEILARGRRVDEAMDVWQETLRYAPRNADALNDLGIALAHKGQVREAILTWHKVLGIDPANAAAHYHLGRELLKLGDLVNAGMHTQEALRLDPNLARVKRDLIPADDVQDGMRKMLF